PEKARRAGRSRPPKSAYQRDWCRRRKLSRLIGPTLLRRTQIWTCSSISDASCNGCPGLVLFGCGGHARSVAAVALLAGFDRLLFVDENAQTRESLLGFPVQPQAPEPSDDWICTPCAGDNQRRKTRFQEIAAAGWRIRDGDFATGNTRRRRS